MVLLYFVFTSKPLDLTSISCWSFIIIPQSRKQALPNILLWSLIITQFLNTAKWVFGHIKSHVRQNGLQSHRTLLGHIDNDVQAITTYMVQGWIREVTLNFGRASVGERLRESYT